MKRKNQSSNPIRSLKSRRWLPSFALGILSAIVTTIPVQAAEKLFFTYSPIHLSLRVASLEIFAKDGIVNQDLAGNFRLVGVNDEQKAKFREALLKRADINPVQLSRFFNTEIGEDILERLGRLITIQGGRNGKYAIRGALIQAGLSPQGLTLLNFLQKLPTNMQFQGQEILELVQTIDLIVLATNQFSENIAQLSAQEIAQNPPVDFAKLPDLRQPGSFGIQPKQTWILKDKKRNRQFYVDVYKPQRWREGKTPVIIMSHGLASRPEDFAGFAEHLASYGYVVVLPQHPGSDSQQAQAFLNGFSRKVFDVNEFINRPLDISYVIDELELRNQKEFDGRLNLESVGIAGHSFGGYTALAVAGAEIDFENLAQYCNRDSSYLNISLLLQCRALALPRQNYDFRDKRVGAIIAINPFLSSIFGRQELGRIDIPVMLVSGSYDPATPAVFEQIRAFPWLKTPNKYLVLQEGQAHVDFSQLDPGVTDIVDSLGNLTLPSPDLLNQYSNALFLPYFEVYIGNNTSKSPFLQSAYAAYLSQGEPFKVYLITGASSEELGKIILQFREDRGIRLNNP